jgi:hypothetical protein
MIPGTKARAVCSEMEMPKNRTKFIALSLAMFLAGCAGSAPTKPPAAAAHGKTDWSTRYGEFYLRTWGIEIIGVKLVSSGAILEFRYRVVDADKAMPLFEKASKPYLRDELSGAMLAVPALEKVGELRQTAKPQAGRIYYMVFGNPSKIVKPGNRVSVVVGRVRVDGLIVQ